MVKNEVKEERVDYVLPKNLFGTDSHHTVILNGVAYQIKKGERVSIPAGVAEILDHAMEGEAAAQELMNNTDSHLIYSLRANQ